MRNLDIIFRRAFFSSSSLQALEMSLIVNLLLTLTNALSISARIRNGEGSNDSVSLTERTERDSRRYQLFHSILCYPTNVRLSNIIF